MTALGGGQPPLSHEALEAIRERCERATAGPWRRAVGDASRLISDGPDGMWRLAMFHDCYDGSTNLDFCANARTDVPRLLAEVERLHGQVPLDMDTLRERVYAEHREKLIRRMPEAAAAFGLADALEAKGRHHRAAHPTGNMAETMFAGAATIRRLAEQVGILTAIQSREAALRALVETWRQRSTQEPYDDADIGESLAFADCAAELSRLLDEGKE